MESVYTNRVSVDLIVGGAFASYAVASQADVIVLIDSRDEVDQVPDMPRLIKVPLGGQDTVLSLLSRVQEAHPELRALLAEYRNSPNVDLGAGMAQDPRLGACAILDLEADGALELLFKKIFIRVLEAGNGQVDLLRLRELNSNAGGMGARGSPAVGARFCTYAAQRTPAKIRREMIRIGGLTYVAVAPRAFRNVEETTRENLLVLHDTQAPVGQIPNLEFYELPLRSENGLAVRDNRALRNYLAGTLAQARFTGDLNRALTLREVNETSLSHFGGMLRGRAWWSKSLDQELLLRAAASYYREQLKALRQRLDPEERGIPQRIEVELEPREHPLPPVENVMAALRKSGVRSPQLDEFAQATFQTFSAGVQVHTQAQAAACDEVLGPAERPPTLAAFQGRRQRASDLLARLRRASAEAYTLQETTMKVFESQRQAVRQQVRRLRSFWHRFDVLYYTRRVVFQRFQTHLETYQAAYGRASEAKARGEVLAGAVAQVEQDLAQYETQWLTRIERRLEAVTGKWTVHLDTVNFAPLEAVYGALLDATLRVTVEEANGQNARAGTILRPVLLRTVTRVTFKGLGEMLGTLSDPGSILSALEEKRFAFASPLWGGMSSAAEPRYRFVVLPPMSAADLAELRKTAEERHYAPLLVTADTAVAGCCIVALAFFPVTNPDEAQPPIYSNGKVATNGHLPEAVVGNGIPPVHAHGEKERNNAS